MKKGETLPTIVIPEAVPSVVPSPELEPQPKPSDIRQLRADLARWLSIPPEDRDLVDFALSVYKSHEIPGDPLWGIIIDASGAGKTELLRAFRNRPDAYFLSNLTENTLVSGYRDPKTPDKDPSVLPELDEKVLIIKDLAPLLGMRAEARSAVIAGLRDAYDGFTDQGRGNLGRVSYDSRFSLLAASTLAIERTDTVEQELGERFIKFRARSGESRDKVRKAISNIGSDRHTKWSNPILTSARGRYPSRQGVGEAAARPCGGSRKLRAGQFRLRHGGPGG